MGKEKIKYDYINQKIEEDNNIDNKSKQTLKKYNKTVIKLMENNIKNYSTIVSNCSSIPKSKFIEYIELIYQEYGLFDDIDYYKKYSDLDECSNNLLIIKDINVLRLDSLGEFLNTCYKMSISLIIFADKDISYYKQLNEKESVELDNLIEIYNYKLEEKDYYVTLLEKYKTKNIECDITDEQLKKIINEFSNKTNYSGLDLIDFIYEYSIKKMDKKKKIITSDLLQDSKIRESKIIDLDSMVGLKNVKREIKELKNYLEFRKKSKVNLSDLSLNMVLVGNSGVGKTEVAKILGTILYEYGLLESDEVVLVTASQLTGEHVGETKNVTSAILRKATGKLLIIDEAYNLYSNKYRNGNNPYMDEAIELLLDYLNNPKNIVFFLGYKKEMKELYKANAGIKSRIYKEIEFEDYTTDELIQILENHLNSQGLKMSPAAIGDIKLYIEENKKNKNFGNARFIKNKLAQDLIINHSNRNLKVENFTIEKEDIPMLEKERGFGLV